MTGAGGEGRLRSGSGGSLNSDSWDRSSKHHLRASGGLRRSNSGAGRSAGNGAGAGTGAGARAGARSTESEIDTRLVGLVDRLGVPVPLQHTVTGGATLAAEVIGDGDAEVGLVGGDAGGSGGIDIPGDQGLADDTVGRGVDDGDVSDAGVGSADINCEVDFLAGGIGLDVVLVVGELVTLAKPDVALSVFVVALAGGDLQLALDVAVVVGLLVGLDLLAAGGFHCVAGHTGFWAGDEAMGVDQGDNAGEGQGGELLHFWGLDVGERMEVIGKPVPMKECILKEALHGIKPEKNECRMKNKNSR